MSSQSAAPPAGGHARAGRRRPGGRPLEWLRNAPIRRKLALIIVIPLATVLALAGLRLDTNVREASSATELRNMVRLSVAASAFTDQLAHESLAATRLVLSTDDDSTAFDRQAARTDRAADAYRAQRKALGDVPSDVAESLGSVDSYLATLPALRDTVRHRNTVGQAVAMRYDTIIASLNTYRSSISAHAGGSNAGNALRASALFSDAKAALAYEEALAYAGMSSGQFGPHAREEFLSALVAQEQSMVSFLRTATPQQQDLVTNTVTGDAVDLADNLVDPLTHAEGEGLPATVRGGPDDVARALGAVSDLMRWVEQKLDAQIAGDVGTYRDQVVREVTVESLAVLLAIALALLVTVLLARMMSRSLRRLRLAADTVARRDLPDAVAKLSAVGNVRSDTLPALVEGSYDPIRITGTDEVGQVAASFNGVHREALRIALEQAALRMNVSATFVSLARRSQKLVDKMIARLDQVERDEEHPERLRDLFDLDHLATRMRRNDENLLILADADGGSARLEDAGLADVLAAAQSEIARYERITIGPLNIGGNESEALAIVAAAVNDVVRLFAELLENAAAFSPPSRRVMVTARRVADQVVVEIEDHGIGMTQARRDELNRQLADDTERSLASVRMMGFAVVSKLSARHNIRVHLGAGDEGGTIVHVVLPPALIVVTAPAPRHAVAAREPERELAYEGVGRGTPARSRLTAPPPTAPSERRPGDTPRLGPVPPPAPALAEAATAQLPVVASDGSDWFMSSTVKFTDGREDARRRPAGARPAPRPGPPSTTAARPVEPRSVEPRPVEPRSVEPRSAEPRQPEPRTAGPAPSSRHDQTSHPSSRHDAAPPRSRHEAAPPSPRDGAARQPEPRYDAAPQPGSRYDAAAQPKPRYDAPGSAGPRPADPRYPGSGAAQPARPAPGPQFTRTAQHPGWEAAERAGRPSVDTRTAGGLPKRDPMANLVPGGFEARPTEIPRSANGVRSFLTEFQRGVSSGRDHRPRPDRPPEPGSAPFPSSHPNRSTGES